MINDAVVEEPSVSVVFVIPQATNNEAGSVLTKFMKSDL